MNCPFCALADRDLVAENPLAAAFRDGFPVSPGHTLIVPRRHVATWFDASRDEQTAILDLAEQVKTDLDAELRPAGYNLGLNVGEAAGQTVPHLHLHVIPRFENDVDDPTGGVRFVIPQRGNYREPGFIPTVREGAHTRARPLAVGGAGDPFLSHLVPLFARADDIAILAAFIQDSGVKRLEPYLLSALERGARIRLLTGDYLNITQCHALRRVLDLGRGAVGEGRATGSLELRVVEVAGLGAGSKSFHPKSWLFLGRDLGSAFVGSSNLSHSALGGGIEWNLRVDQARDPEAFLRVSQEFAVWWGRAVAVDDAWIEAYEQRAHAGVGAVLPGEIESGSDDVPVPRDVQLEALERLRRARAEGRTRALIVFATGLGKTWLAAFDAWRFAEQLGHRPRVLFLAHRAEILQQAAAAFRGLFREERFGWYLAEDSDLSADLVFASVQKLARRENLARLASDAFDYVVVDEVHHADARTYRRILGHLKPGFLLGLTATPERADAGDIFGLFDDFVAHRADLGVGIELGHLVPFRYWGIKDTADYRPIPWRNGRFDSEALARAVETEARMVRLWEGWQAHAGTRTLVFCCSIAHARFVAGWLAEKGVRAAAVHSGTESADRAEALWRLAEGELDAVCAVDLFNEGIDVPLVDRVVMLRPTESPIVFLQQLGRGLRTADGKEALQVIDFVGNHRVFLDRVRTLLSLGEKTMVTSIQALLEKGRAPDLPPGCSVEIELEAVELLRKLLPTGGDRRELVRAYRDLKASRGRRPTIGELYRMGYNTRSLRTYGSWFEFVRAEGDLKGDEATALEESGKWLEAVEITETMTRSYKMVALEALLDAGAFQTGMTVAENARRSYEIMRRSPELFADLQGTQELPDPTNVSTADWATYWKKWPLTRWAGAGRRSREKAWFRLEGDRFEPVFVVQPKVAEVLAEMTRELVDYRLARYRRTKQQTTTGEGTVFEAAVSLSRSDPILILPDREQIPGVPRGETDVRLEDGCFWRFRFTKGAVNVAHPVGSSRNELPDLLRRWFGPDTGKSGTTFSVRFSPSPNGWLVEAVAGENAKVLPSPAEDSAEDRVT